MVVIRPVLTGSKQTCAKLGHSDLCWLAAIRPVLTERTQTCADWQQSDLCWLTALTSLKPKKALQCCSSKLLINALLWIGLHLNKVTLNWYYYTTEINLQFSKWILISNFSIQVGIHYCSMFANVQQMMFISEIEALELKSKIGVLQLNI